MVFPVQLASHLLSLDGNEQHSSQLNLFGSTNQSEMNPNNGEAARVSNNSRKRKMKEVVETAAESPHPLSSAANLLALHRQQQFPPSPLSTALHMNINGGHIGQSSKPSGGFNIGQSSSSQATAHHIGQPSLPPPSQSQVMMELSKPVKSYTALLNEDDDKDEINFIIKNHGDQLKRTLTEMSWKHYNTLAFLVEEKASKRVKEKEMTLNQMMIKNAELQQMAAQFKQEAQAAQAKVKTLENAVVAMKVSLNEANVRGGNSMNNAVGGLQLHEDAESSFTDPSRGVEPIRLACKACDKQVANMMLWPCHHVALCTKCDARAKVCPVCSRAKTMSIELGLP